MTRPAHQAGDVHPELHLERDHRVTVEGPELLDQERAKGRGVEAGHLHAPDEGKGHVAHPVNDPGTLNRRDRLCGRRMEDRFDLIPRAHAVRRLAGHFGLGNGALAGGGHGVLYQAVPGLGGHHGGRGLFRVRGRFGREGRWGGFGVGRYGAGFCDRIGDVQRDVGGWVQNRNSSSNCVQGGIRHEIPPDSRDGFGARGRQRVARSRGLPVRHGRATNRVDAGARSDGDAGASARNDQLLTGIDPVRILHDLRVRFVDLLPSPRSPVVLPGDRPGFRPARPDGRR